MTNQLSGDGDGDFFRRARSDGNANRSPDTLGDAGFCSPGAETFENCSDFTAATDQSNITGCTFQSLGERQFIVLMTSSGDDDAGIRGDLQSVDAFSEGSTKYLTGCGKSLRVGEI
ncbi:MAG TPA: hypothetical protein EYN40_05560 [Planctomycetes bacterium]|nr:hypothetical protein [Planctomycetota bacterium]